MTSRSHRQTGTHRSIVSNISQQVRSGSGRLFIPCPRCGAKPGWSCVSMKKMGTDDDGVAYTPPRLKDFHPERSVRKRRDQVESG